VDKQICVFSSRFILAINEDTYKHTHTHVPWIRKFVIATIGCGISHKNTKLTDKCSNNKTKTTQKQNDKTTNKYFSNFCKDNAECKSKERISEMCIQIWIRPTAFNSFWFVFRDRMLNTLSHLDS